MVNLDFVAVPLLRPEQKAILDKSLCVSHSGVGPTCIIVSTLQDVPVEQNTCVDTKFSHAEISQQMLSELDKEHTEKPTKLNFSYLPFGEGASNCTAAKSLRSQECHVTENQTSFGENNPPVLKQVLPDPTRPPNNFVAYLMGETDFTTYRTQSGEDEMETEAYKQWFRSMGMMPP